MPDVLDLLDGEVGDALGLVLGLRNMVAHPGAYLRQPTRPDFDNREHMRATYQVVDGITAEVFQALKNRVDANPTA